MSEYKVSNCPSFVLMRTATSGTYFDMCGNAKGHIKCADCIDCVIKQVIEECKWETNIDVNDRGDLAERILSSFDIEEVR